MKARLSKSCLLIGLIFSCAPVDADSTTGTGAHEEITSTSAGSGEDFQCFDFNLDPYTDLQVETDLLVSKNSQVS